VSRPLYSARFLAVHAGAGATFVCPAGFRAVVRGITAFNASAIAHANAQLLHVDSDATLYQVDLGLQSFDWTDFRFVFNEGESIQAIPDSTVDMTVSGFLLTAP